jgi:hypothetical protein
MASTQPGATTSTNVVDQSICTSASPHLCLSDNDASPIGGNPIYMRGQTNAPSQILRIVSNDTYGCTTVSAKKRCPFKNSKLDDNYDNSPVVSLNFNEIGSNDCVGAVTTSDRSVILSACSADRATWVQVATNFFVEVSTPTTRH